VYVCSPNNEIESLLVVDRLVKKRVRVLKNEKERKKSRQKKVFLKGRFGR